MRACLACACTVYSWRRLLTRCSPRPSWHTRSETLGHREKTAQLRGHTAGEGMLTRWLRGYTADQPRSRHSRPFQWSSLLLVFQEDDPGLLLPSVARRDVKIKWWVMERSSRNVTVTVIMDLPCCVVGRKAEEEEKQMRRAQQMVPETDDRNVFLQHVSDDLP